MQYILTEEEYRSLKEKASYCNEHADNVRAINTLKTKLMKGHACIHDEVGPRYCDDCPLADFENRTHHNKHVCSETKNWSK